VTACGSEARCCLRTTAAGVALAPALVGAMLVELPAAPRARELAVAGAAARGAADALGGQGARGRRKGAAALGASTAGRHLGSVAGRSEVAAFAAERGPEGRRWITKAPRAALSDGGAVDQQGAAGWIRGRAPLKASGAHRVASTLFPLRPEPHPRAREA